MHWLGTGETWASRNWQTETQGPEIQAVERHQNTVSLLHEKISEVIRGKEEVINSFLTAVLAAGSILLEDLPGVGKTTLAKTFAKLVDLSFSRLQCTPDILPSDVYGFSVYNATEGTFTFRPGPVFCNILLVDEINRASPRTQSALLEAMGESQVTIEGERRQLESPFLVIATQNPLGFHGTYPLPEAQLDRFLLHLVMDYPDRSNEIELLYEQDSEKLARIVPVLDAQGLLELQAATRSVEVHRDVADYMVRIVEATRQDERIAIGGSPRGTQMLFRAAQANALISGRTFAIPDDVQKVAPMTLAHRIVMKRGAFTGGFAGRHSDKREMIQDLVRSVEIPV